ncbi:hypothetical protein [Weissella cibaria]|nr:hypothetical protein [Weissella cibaria]
MKFNVELKSIIETLRLYKTGVLDEVNTRIQMATNEDFDEV